MHNIVIVSGSPFAPSRTDLVLQHVESLLQKKGITASYISVTNIPPEDLVYARFDSPTIKHIVTLIQDADGIIIASPVYKGSYTGVLKSLFDLLPEHAFNGLPVLPLMVGGSSAHLLAIEYSLKPLIHNLKGSSAQGVYFVNSCIDKEQPDQPITDPDCVVRLHTQVQELIDTIELKKNASQLVHS